MSTETTSFDPDRAQGALIGLAAGDKNRGPTEMALMVAESLTDEQRFDLDDITSRWLSWWQQGAWDEGRVFDAVMQMIDEGVTRESAAKHAHQELNEMTAGCNGAHRVPALAAFEGITDDQLDEVAAQLTARTHQHPLAQDAAVATARICRAFIRGMPVGKAMQAGGEGLDPVIQASIGESIYAPAGIGGFSPETLQSALHFLVTRNNFDAALNDALEFAGPPNYCPVLVGAFAGARWGFRSIDKHHLSHCREPERVLSVARSLVRKS